MPFLNVLQLLFAPKSLEKESLAKEKDISAETIQETIAAKRTALVSTIPWILITATLGFVVAQILNHFYTVPIHLIPWLRICSLSVLAFAALSRLGEVPTSDGDSLPEKTNTLLFKLLYSFGFFLTIATLSLDIHSGI